MVERRENAEEPGEGPRSFTRMLEALNDGVLCHELSLEQFKLLKLLFGEAQESGADTTSKGELHLILRYEVGNDHTIDINAEIKKKEPKKRRNRTTAWVTPAGNVSFEYPRQENLPGVSLVGSRQPPRTMPQQPQARSMGASQPNPPVQSGNDDENGGS